MNDDTALLRRYAEEKSEAAFAELVRRHLDLVYSAALRRLGGDAHRAADVAQQVFTTLARDAAKLSRHAVLAAWLYTATRHAAIDFIRAEQRRSAREQEASTMQTLFSATPDAGWEKLRPVLDEVMDELSDADRTAVLLRFFEKRPFAEIGVALDLSEDAARMRVERALQKLHVLLARRGVTSTSAALAVVLANQAVALAPANLATTVTAAAFAGAAGGSVALAGGAITFMSTSKLAMVIAALVAAIGAGSAIYEAKIAAQAVTELAALRKQQSAVAAKAADLEAKLHAAEQAGETAATRAAALEKDLALAKKSAASAAPRPATASANSSGGPYSNPAYVRANVEKFQISLGLRYGPLYRTLNLSPEQIARFEAALTEAEQGAMDIFSAASSQGLSTGSDSAANTAVARMTSGPIGAAQETVKALLGENGYEKYQEFDKARAARDLVASLAGNVYYSETPLTAQQGDTLTEILTANTQKIKIPMASDGKSPMYWTSEAIDWEAVKVQAQILLSPTQLTALRILTEQARLDREIAQILRPPPKPAEKQPGG